MTNNIKFLNWVESRLRAADVLSPRVEAETLITHFGKMDRMQLFTGEKKINTSAIRSIQKALKTRRTGRPLSHLTGEAPFYGRSFLITKDTLIPRPETELIVEKTLSLIKETGGNPPQILDMGTGSGCIAISLTLEYPACRMTALDASSKALRMARKNAARFGVGGSLRFVQSIFFSAFGGKKAGFWDFIVSNPPYIPEEMWDHLSKEVRSEPRLALDGGPSGLGVILGLLEKAPFYLKKGGWLLIEIGKGQSAPLKKTLKKNGSYSRFDFVKDLNGIDRVLVARKHG